MGLWFVQVNRLIREIRQKALDAQKTKAKTAIASIKKYLQADYDALCEQWPKNLKCSHLADLGRHISFAQSVDFRDMIEFDLPGVESTAEKHFLSAQPTAPSSDLESLLHPAIRASSYQQFRDGHLRDAVLNSLIGLLDHVHKVSGEKTDGAKLANDVFGGSAPLLVFSTLDTESGRNDQGGFHKIFLGAVEGIRNPKAHSLDHDLNATKTAQYLVMASLLCRRVDECHIGHGRT